MVKFYMVKPMNYLTQNLQNEIAKLEVHKTELNTSLQTEKDLGMVTLINEELNSLQEQIDALNESLGSGGSAQNTPEKDGATGIDPNLAIVEIRAGTGGNEAGLFAYDLYKMYAKYAEKVKWKLQVLNFSENISGGMKFVTFELKGKNAYDMLKNESGVHRVQRIPQTESAGRIHTSTATVAVLPQLLKIEIEIRPEDIKMDFFRSGGHGGQNVNKVSTAVRLTHLPTGVVVECQEERYQAKNREKAMNMLQSKLYNMMQEQQVRNITDLRAEQVGSGERSEKIRTYNYPQDRITDHRIGVSWHNMISVMEGNIDRILEDCAKIGKA